MDKIESKKRLEKVKDQLREIDHAYYVLDEPFVTDAVRDSLKDEVELIEAKFPDLVTPDSPTQRLGGVALDKFKKVKHEIKKYSLDDVFSFDEVKAFDLRVRKFLKLSSDEVIEYTCELKIDGLNMSFHYVDGVFEKAVTRGDGVLGEDVTHTVKTIKSLPLRLQEDIDVEVGGEVFMPKKSFDRINKILEKKGKKPFANPRNAAAGSVRQLDARVAADRDLDLFCWSVYNGKNYKTQIELLDGMKKMGFKVNPEFKVVNSVREIIDYCESWTEKRNGLSYDIDGIAIKVNRLDWQKRLGRAAKYVRWACAYKFPAEQATTVVEDIVWQVGRTGALTPVAHLKPVQIAGSVVSRATLHNIEELQRKDVRIGDTVIIHKAGDIIPEIVEVLVKMRDGDEKKVNAPKKCPICESAVVKKEGNVAICCSNKKCFAQEKENISHFVSRKGFNIEGLGEKIIEQLINEGLIQNAVDIFALKIGDLHPLERFAEKSAENLIEAIEESKSSTPLSKLIFSLGIRYIGEETSSLLAQSFKSETISEFLEKLSSASVSDLFQIEGVGEKVAESIHEYFHTEESVNDVKRLETLGVTLAEVEAVKEKEGVFGKTFVLTGSLDNMSRDEAKVLIKNAGGKVSSAVSSKTDYVLAGDDPGAKFKKAESLNIKILNEKQFIALIK